MSLCACGCGQDAGIWGRHYVGGKNMEGQPKEFLGKHSMRKKTCIRGHLLLPENRYPSGPCKLCGRVRDEERRTEVIARIVTNQKKNPEKHAKEVRDWAKSQAGRISVRATKAKQLYGLSPEQYDDILLGQEGKCEVCRVEMTAESHKKTSVAVDHDHACCPGNKSCGKCIRGMLCSMCNFMLGFANDNVETLANAIQYLNKFKENQCQTQEKPTSYAQNQPEPILGAWVKPSYQELSFSQMETTA